ncbi:MAG: endolytic transglycosylase MltG [Crocinitomicaceae bacterium]
MSKRKLIIVGLVLAIVGSFALVPKVLIYLAGNHKSINQNTQAFYLSSPLNLPELAQRLSEEKLIDDIKSFISVGEYKELNARNIAAGKYLIEPGTNYRNLLNGFTKNAKGNGNAEVEVEVTFNNCRDVYQMAAKVAKCIDVDSAQLVNYLYDGQTLNRLGFTAEQLPALFIPDSYQMYWDSDEKMFVDRMAKEFKKFWTPDRKNSLNKIGLKTQSQVVTLASIVCSEQSRQADEWPIIAGLYLNRLKQGMKLQSDPTFKFCWGNQLNGVQRLLAVHRDVECAYNTYKEKGLPPGPICLPSPKVVDAVLHPAQVDYIFMCAKPDYTHRHNFAVSGAEHMKNAKAFQSWLTIEQRKKKN